MRNSRLASVSMVSLMVFFIAGIAGASMTERMEGNFLKTRIKQRIDENWLIYAGNPSGTPQDSNFADASWTTTNLPHDFSITLVKIIPGAQCDPPAIGWYRKHFTLPPGFAGKKVIIQFDGIYHDSKIWLNGHLVGNQQYGYVSFYFDLTPYLSATGDNVLAVYVDDETIQNSRWYSGTGIFRHVWLIATDYVYVKNWGTAITTPTATAGQSKIRIQTEVVNDLTTAQTRTLQTTICDASGNALLTADTTISVKPNVIDTVMSIDTCVQTLTLSPCNLWSPSTPVLYYAYTRLLNNGTPADDYVTRFGIRQLQYNVNQGLVINGVATKMKGICMHQMLVPAGSAVPDLMFARAITELKKSGCSSIRTSHNPETSEFYDICDSLGMLVLDEYCDKWVDTVAGNWYENWNQTWPKDLSSFIERDRNHPSIVMWSVGNEVTQLADITSYLEDTLKVLVTYVKHIDSSRDVTHACVSGWSDIAGFATLANYEDIVGVNYQDWGFATMHSDNPNAILLGTEQDNYLGSTGVPVWFEARNTPYVIGTHIWTGVDYLGEGTGSLGATSGYLDNCIFRKSWFYFMQSQYSDTPMVHVTIGNGTSSSSGLAENWTNLSGAQSVVTYTNCDSVSLYVNTTKVGTELLSNFPSTIMQWTNVSYQSGYIKAIGFKNGVQAAVDSILTAGAAAKVLLKPDRTTMFADGSDVSCIEVDIVDANDNFVFSADNTIQFSVSGQGRSLGIASGNWNDDSPFKATSRAAYNGKALIVVQSLPTPGTITVTVSPPGLVSSSVTITTVAQPTTAIIPSAPSRNAPGSRVDQFTCMYNTGSKNIQVRYRVDVPGAISLSVFSASGRLVNCLANNKYQAAGIYSTEWNAAARSGGVYFVVLKVNNRLMTRKVFIAR
ncbi:MAG: glycoside hydrolase family 2 TIM barrel-domain containing protein [Chitinispirillaceae bacterium]